MNEKRFIAATVATWIIILAGLLAIILSISYSSR